jgi:hypothetical protein
LLWVTGMNRRISCLGLALMALGCGGEESMPGGLPAFSGNNNGGGTLNLGGNAGAGGGGGAMGSASTNRSDAGAGQTTGGQMREYGVGDYAVTLTSTAPPPRLCWYTEETTRVCDGSPPTKRTFVEDSCTDGGQSCLANEPPDSEKETGSCWIRVDYETVGGGALTGDCATLAAYHRNYLTGACMFHKHCPGGKCVDYQCTGANYHLPGAPGGPGGPGTGMSPDASPSDNPQPQPMRGGSADAGAPDTLPVMTPDPTPAPPDASPPPPAPAPGGPGGPAPPMR